MENDSLIDRMKITNLIDMLKHYSDQEVNNYLEAVPVEQFRKDFEHTLEKYVEENTIVTILKNI